MSTLLTLDRPQLRTLVHRLAGERNRARASAEFWRRKVLREDWWDWTPEQTTRAAQAVLDEIGADPHARDHLDTLEMELRANDPRTKETAA